MRDNRLVEAAGRVKVEVENEVVEADADIEGVEVEGVEVDVELEGVDVEGVEVAWEIGAETMALVSIASIVRMLPSSAHVESMAIAMAQSLSVFGWGETLLSSSESTMIGIGATKDVIATSCASIMIQV